METHALASNGLGEEKGVEMANQTPFSYRSIASYKVDPLACAYCAKCHSICPTYLPTKNEGYSARGKILLYSALKGDFDNLANPSGARISQSLAKEASALLDYLNFCTRCYRCLEVCPAGMATVPIFEQMHFALSRLTPPSLPMRILMCVILPNRSLTRLFASLLETPFSLLPFLARRTKLTKALRAWLYSLPKYETLFCSLANGSPTIYAFGREFAIPASPLRRAQTLQFAERLQKLPRPKESASPVAIFNDCLGELYYPGVFYSTARLLNRLGYLVLMHPSPSCCGASALNTGDERAFVAMAKNFAYQFSNLKDERGERPASIIFTNPTCFKTVKERYKEYLSEEELKGLPEIHLDTDFILPRLKKAGISANGTPLSEIPMAWHNPCSLSYSLGVKGAKIVSALNELGLPIQEFPEVEGCCGFGGMFYLRYPKRAEELSAEKHFLWRQNGIELVLSNSAGCISHINATAIKLNLRRRSPHEAFYPPAVHYLEILSRLAI